MSVAYGLSKLFGALMGWARANPWQVIFIALCCLAVFYRHAAANADARADRYQIEASNWRSDFLAQRDEMRKVPGLLRIARAAAARLDAENKVRVETLWRAKLKDVTDDYQGAHATALAALDKRLFGGRSAVCGEGSGSSGGATKLPIISTLPEGALRAGGSAIVSRSDALICEANTVRLEAVIAAWKSAAKIDVNNGADTAAATPLQGR